MKANGLNGEYCQTCASILDDVQRTFKRVIVLDSQCLAVFQQSGDANRLEERVKPSKDPEADRHVSPGLPKYEEQKKSEAVKETVHAKAEEKPEPKKTEHKTTGRKR